MEWVLFIHSRLIMSNTAVATWIDQQRFVATGSSHHSIVVDGDKNTANSPMELVLLGLCGCTGYDVVSILRKKREPFTSVEVRAEAERAPEPPTVYTAIRLVYRVGGKVSHKAVEDAVKLSEEKYCSVAAMLNKTAKISYTIEYARAETCSMVGCVGRGGVRRAPASAHRKTQIFSWIPIHRRQLSVMGDRGDPWPCRVHRKAVSRETRASSD